MKKEYNIFDFDKYFMKFFDIDNILYGTNDYISRDKEGIVLIDINKIDDLKTFVSELISVKPYSLSFNMKYKRRYACLTLRISIVNSTILLKNIQNSEFISLFSRELDYNNLFILKEAAHIYNGLYSINIQPKFSNINKCNEYLYIDRLGFISIRDKFMLHRVYSSVVYFNLAKVTNYDELTKNLEKIGNIKNVYFNVDRNAMNDVSILYLCIEYKHIGDVRITNLDEKFVSIFFNIFDKIPLDALKQLRDSYENLPVDLKLEMELK